MRISISSSSGRRAVAVALGTVLTLVASSGSGVRGTSAVSVSVDPSADRRPVDPRIFGVNDTAFLAPSQTPQTRWRTDYTVVRWGGNYATRYNYKLDAFNSGSDYYFINFTFPTERQAKHTPPPKVTTADRLVAQTLDAGRDEIFTIPMIGWTVKDRVYRWSYSVSKYGPQPTNECTGRIIGLTPDPYLPLYCQPDAGDGRDVRSADPGDSGGYGFPEYRRDNDPTDTSARVGLDQARAWMRHLVSRFGDSAHGGIKYMTLDNEPMLWYFTHADVRHTPLGYDELWTKTREYAAVIKGVDPRIEIFGPAEWGWCGYFTSTIDHLRGDGCTNGPDRKTHGDVPLLEWYLEQVCRHPLASGRRAVDYLDVHYYPGGGTLSFGDDSNEDVNRMRLRSLRSLYDPSYVDESWIGRPVVLIPRLRAWISRACPGTKLAITEYNWGDGDSASAIAQAEALAIFAREGVAVATRFSAPVAGSRLDDAFRLYLDYDGHGAKVEGSSVRAASSDVDAVGAYAVAGRGGRVYLLLFNKDTRARPVRAVVRGAGSGRVPLYRFDAAHALGRAPTTTVRSGVLETELPARSATLAVID